MLEAQLVSLAGSVFKLLLFHLELTHLSISTRLLLLLFPFELFLVLLTLNLLDGLQLATTRCILDLLHFHVLLVPADLILIKLDVLVSVLFLDEVVDVAIVAAFDGAKQTFSL